MDDELLKRQAANYDELKKTDHGKIYFADINEMDISSTEVRKRIAMEESLNALLPEKVLAYIESEHLYKPV